MAPPVSADPVLAKSATDKSKKKSKKDPSAPKAGKTEKVDQEADNTKIAGAEDKSAEALKLAQELEAKAEELWRVAAFFRAKHGLEPVEAKKDRAEVSGNAQANDDASHRDESVSPVSGGSGEAQDSLTVTEAIASQLMNTVAAFRASRALASEQKDNGAPKPPTQVVGDPMDVEDPSEVKVKKSKKDKKDKKKKKKKTKDTDIDEPVDAEAGADADADDADMLLDDAPPVKIKKDKKEKKKKDKKKGLGESVADAVVDQPSNGTPATDDDKTREPSEAKSKKEKNKDKKRKRDADDTQPSLDLKQDQTLRDAAPAQDVKKNSSKKAKMESPAVQASAERTPAASTAQKWNVGSLEGGSDRQSKFLRLLGAGKAGISKAGPKQGTAAPGLDIHRVQDELQRQYDAGLKMKFDGQGQRRGLGA